jgi:hypothetical protein
MAALARPPPRRPRMTAVVLSSVALASAAFADAALAAVRGAGRLAPLVPSGAVD